MDLKSGNYEIIEEIGRGGMAVVYRAVQKSLDRIVAIKELDLFRISSTPNALQRFRLEAKAAASLDHPNIITIYDFRENEGKAYNARSSRIFKIPSGLHTIVVNNPVRGKRAFILDLKPGERKKIQADFQ